MVLREQGHFRKWLFTVSHLPRRSLRYSRTKTRPPEPTKVAIGHLSPRVTAWRLSAPERPPRPAQMGRGGGGGPNDEGDRPGVRSSRPKETAGRAIGQGDA